MGTEHGPEIWLKADWPAPPWISAGTSTRLGGASNVPFDSLNMAMHVGDDPESVDKNRKRVCELLNLPSQPVWLNQKHGNTIITNPLHPVSIAADGSYTNQKGIVCTVMTADCIPLLISNKAGKEIAAVHIGWRGLCSGIISSAIELFRDSPANLLAWIGPHISTDHYEVGDEVRNACAALDDSTVTGFVRNQNRRWQADLEEITRIILTKNGISSIFSAGHCTFSENHLFFSYRRNYKTGRMASFIWMDKTGN